MSGIFTARQIAVLEAAEVTELVCHEPLRGYGANDRDSWIRNALKSDYIRFNTNTVKSVQKYLKRVAYQSLASTYGLNEAGKNVLAEHRRLEKATYTATDNMNASILAVAGQEFDPKAKFDKPAIWNIRRACAAGVKFTEMAKIYSCSASMIRNIHLRKVYAWVEEEDTTLPITLKLEGGLHS